MGSWFTRLFSGPSQRTAGRPTSSNGASSLHLAWDAPTSDRLIGVSVTLEVLSRPDIDELVFMAMQVSFTDPGGGGAHLGLQHHPRYPLRSAVNWGGYAEWGGLLSGSDSALPSTPADVNTRNFEWQAGTPYVLEISRQGQRPEGGWAWSGSVTNPSGARTIVRELYSPGSSIRDPVVWIECFAPCDAPSFIVRWSEPTVTTADAVVLPVPSMRVSYQGVAHGGCTNTTSSVDGSSFVQRTNATRSTPQGKRLTIA